MATNSRANRGGSIAPPLGGPKPHLASAVSPGSFPQAVFRKISAVFEIAERREPPGRMAIAAQKTENAVCLEGQRGGYGDWRAGRAAYADALKKAAGRLAPKI